MNGDIIMTFKTLIPIGCRSDEGLIMPVIRRLEKDPAFEVMQYDLKPMDFIESYRITVDKINEFHPDLFFANADRVEMCGATAAAFHNKVKIAHYQAGVVNDPITTFDDVDRHVITLWSDIQFVENNEAEDMVYILKLAQKGFDTERDHGSYNPYMKIFNVGCTHLDDLSVDESKVPINGYAGYRDPYDLILINYPPLSPTGKTPMEIGKRLTESIIKEFVPNRKKIWIGGNPDGYFKFECENSIYYDHLPRPQFLGLLKNCQRFITNSSCAITEAPYFLKPEQIVMVGDRNRNRPAVECKPGGSDRIVAILKDYANAYN